MNPKVSIIVPVYNTARYLESCIDSLKKIDFKLFEVIFIDNHSSDGSFEILKNIDEKNFKVYRNRKNFGQSYSLNRAISLSKSPFIAIMDSDDICLPNRIKDSYDFLRKNKNYALVAGCSDTINENGDILARRRFTLEFELVKTRILIDNPISHTTVMFRKKILKKTGGYSKKLNFTQDYDLISKIILRGYKVKVLNKKFTLVRKHRKQQSHLFKQQQLNERFHISCKNFNHKVKLDKYFKNLIEYLIFNKSKNFEKFSLNKKGVILENFLNKTFNKDEEKLYFCSLIFSRNNKFEKYFRFKFLIRYLLKNNLFIVKREIFLRTIMSFIKVIF